MSIKEMRWQDLPLGGVILQAGNAALYETGGWRAFRPVINRVKTPTQKACTNCLTCWFYCPDSSMIVVDGRLEGVDLDHCKGCGICASLCPVSCITMVEEGAAE
ncbi:MAG: 4Fe-4S binding protein [Anaerolineales bacterium]|nr:4Fe-4S binding protein [Anaerolineales bacterium]